MPTAVTLKPGSLSAKRAAEYLDVAEQTLAKWRCHGEGPTFVKINSKILYRVESLEKYLQDHEQPTSRRRTR